MNERQLQRLLQRLLALSAPLPLALLGSACGGSASMDTGGEAGSGASAGMATGGVAGAVSAGAGGAGAGFAGTGNGGASAGTGGASAGTGGANAGAGGALAGAGGANAGAGGVGGGCKSAMITFCNGSDNVVPKACVDASMSSVGSALPMTTCAAICNTMFGSTCSVSAVDSTSVTVHCIAFCPAGRRPAGLEETSTFGEIGGYFAELTRLEAASVPAFRILRNELRAHGAPQKLVRAAARAARDEVRHARAARALARRHGAPVQPTHIPRGMPRPLEAIAIENAVEGCVRETYAALLASHQAQRATDPSVRAAMTRIARDETRHAALSWHVALWLEQRLTPAAKRKVAGARQAAVSELLASVAAERTQPFADRVGLPKPATAFALALGMQQALWS
jgi:hypothetical protein